MLNANNLSIALSFTCLILMASTTMASELHSPVANFTSSVTSGIAPLNVVFSDTSTGPPNSWFWDFGDGATSTDQNPTHIYSTPGTYTIKE